MINQQTNIMVGSQNSRMSTPKTSLNVKIVHIIIYYILLYLVHSQFIIFLIPSYRNSNQQHAR